MEQSGYIAELRAGIRNRQQIKKKALVRRKEEAQEKARRAAALIRSRGGGRVFLFGSLVPGRNFWEHSDIDLAVSGLPSEVNFWQLYADVLAQVEPFRADLVILEEAPAELRQQILREGVEL
jgi:Nucleotidyltransferase domain.